MNKRHLIPLLAALGALPAQAAQLDISVQIPQLDVAEYHRPYVAVWVEREDRSVAANLSVWYQVKRNAPPAAPGAAKPPASSESGTKWLPDLRQWWRRGGRDLSMPADGLSSATKPVGTHEQNFGDKSPLASLPPGRYKLVVEAAREDGGRELVDLAFDWPAKAATTLEAQGKSELGAIRVAVKP
ncbi:DUF2271 domain-containing protein [Nevskia sp.]|uniref:DUF2271 domain-containing protein n=1 Tax=Nevskia sp. TaxID=1929292 RepID=UPI0025F33720|nr:DUF2271 domain-containing protein [Nevskia sp.]